MRRIPIRALLLLAFPAVAIAANGWASYANPRYGYSIDIPPGFSTIQEAENSDGGISQSSDGRSGLAVWGAGLLDATFEEDVAGRIGAAGDEGWQISYEKVTARWASWSGTRDGRILYARAIPLCDGDAAYFQIEYPFGERQAYDPIVKRLVKSLKGSECG